MCFEEKLWDRWSKSLYVPQPPTAGAWGCAADKDKTSTRNYDDIYCSLLVANEFTVNLPRVGKTKSVLNSFHVLLKLLSWQLLKNVYTWSWLNCLMKNGLERWDTNPVIHTDQSDSTNNDLDLTFTYRSS